MAGPNSRRNNKGFDIEAPESDRDAGLDLLSEKVSLLKSATMGIKNEVDSHRRILDDLDRNVSGIRGMLGSLGTKFTQVLNNKGNNKYIYGSG
eukprot:CAMPEP_0175086666 /NCGR_PEP_ID=MMETSP0052_2-20121109/29386_1 /TAXON_ID=51329 ORGANISM="Polytomella parva, Strain SAG 63-3" /NCGR_SAMPLE_ID=MMETSP0052_2 /ASSEMBLY_ACC=CAM_ASM_000194 /LENGTH=92 /DNA_ID=CAMNT_0016358895 /DNA_START=132 /DNA_END=407 /DNA_ORIENTATION=+